MSGVATTLTLYRLGAEGELVHFATKNLGKVKDTEEGSAIVDNLVGYYSRGFKVMGELQTAVVNGRRVIIGLIG